MLKQLLSNEVRNFIDAHEADDVHKLLLKFTTVYGLPAKIVVDQIIGKRRAKVKFPTLFENREIIYPTSIHLEQSSSEKAARHKIDVLKSAGPEGFNLLIDLTAGFGIDSFFFSKVFSKVHAVERDIKLVEIAKHNHMELGQTNIEYHGMTAEEFLRRMEGSADLIYIDPSRRNEKTGKVFRFTDSEPDILKLIQNVFEKTNLLIVKASPLLDIQQGITELKFVKEVYVVSIDNDCKELLFVCEKDYVGEAIVKTVNIEKKHTESFQVSLSVEKKISIDFGDPLVYLYEPNASILKAGAFKTIADKFNLKKIDANTHLYTSAELVDSFPGRVFEIEAIVKPSIGTIEKHFPDKMANVILRNYPLSVAELLKRYKLKEGGDKFLIGFSGKQRKYLAASKRIL